MPARAEVLGDWTICREEPLSLSGGFEPLPPSFPLPCGLMRVLGAIVQVAMLAMLYARQDFALRCPIALELIGDDDPCDVLTAFEEFAEKLLGGHFVAAPLHEDVEYMAVLIHGSPEVVARIASKWHKPAGCTIITGKQLHEYLGQVLIGNVWGIGEQTTAYLARFGTTTALDFARKDEQWVRAKLTKPHVAIWHELRGISVIPLEIGEQHDYQSISKTKTFTSPTADREMLLAQLDLFGEALRAERIRQVYEAVDQLDAKYGKHTVFLGSSFAAMQGRQHTGERGELPRRQQILLKGEGKRRRLGIPMLGEVR
jgi:hypothetical protein